MKPWDYHEILCGNTYIGYVMDGERVVCQREYIGINTCFPGEEVARTQKELQEMIIAVNEIKQLQQGMRIFVSGDKRELTGMSLYSYMVSLGMPEQISLEQQTNWLRSVLQIGTAVKTRQDNKNNWFSDMIDQLPKTADNIPVIPGIDYWCSWEDQGYDGESITEFRKCHYVGHAKPHVDYDWEIENCPWDGCNSPPGFEIYSTREAAEAAHAT